MASKRFKELEAKLTPQQRKAALLLVQNDMTDKTDRTRKTMADIAAEVGISERQLYRWKHQNRIFIEYMNAIADDFLASYRANVYRQMMKLINAQQPSVKAMDLYFRRFGLLTDRHVTEVIGDNDDQSNEKIEEEIKELEHELEDLADESDD
ncbi:MAG: helix-turn-helix domain-containing protein [Acidobacterium ailaaui]|nr:helix-turn-helix domain-containing protein [Pseudacidobacterium ailaaui]